MNPLTSVLMNQDHPTDWVVKVKAAGKEPLWIGNFQARGREDAKLEAKRFAARFLPLECRIIAIAQGRIAVQFNGPEIQIDHDA